MAIQFEPGGGALLVIGAGCGGLRHAGISMVEVLVALVIIGVGALGSASLQLYALAWTEQAYFQGQAAVIAQDLIERMRVRAGAAEYLAATHWQTPVDLAATPCVLGFNGVDEVSGCSGIDPIAADVKDILQLVAKRLPSGQISLNTCADRYCVSIAWNGQPLSPCPANVERGLGGCYQISFFL